MTDFTAIAAHVDEARQWDRLMAMARIGATENGGVNRQALSAEDRAARRQFAEWAEALGLVVATDAVGNVFARRPGRDNSLAPVMTGSHLDSQPTGGKFDGAYGVLAGLEALNAMNEAGLETLRPIDVVAWTNEEGSRFQPGCTGSAIYAGAMRLDDVADVVGTDGERFDDALAATLATTPDWPRRSLREPVAAYIEAHIEQGPRLEAAGRVMAAVTGIQGSRRFAVEVIGDEAHAGTAPLRQRRDALKAAAQMVVALEQAMHDPDDVVRFTIGRFEVSPGSPNTVPGHVLFTIDFRHPDAATIDRLCAQIPDVCAAQAGPCRVQVKQISDTAPTQFPPEMVELLQRHANALGYAPMAFPSGAGHDAQYMAAVCPTSMIFVPCEKGLSHNEAESARPADLAAGTRILTAALADLAQRPERL